MIIKRRLFFLVLGFSAGSRSAGYPRIYKNQYKNGWIKTEVFIPG